ncbi:hypothetical protein [Streptomyces sp. KLOTTS4A1]|uniref:hypothetical protein n=1 Tax=Streptomyces sp. KLOTTS4A1 TaxID=3390996 RepID=UPI0039F4F7EE
MTMTGPDPTRAAEEAVRELAAQLRAAGVTLPSLRLDGPSLAAVYPRPLIDLGRCDVDTARRLTAVLKGAR